MSITVIEDLKIERAKQELSLSEMADACGVSEATLSKIFSGKSDNPTIGTICDIAGVLNLEVRAVSNTFAQQETLDAELITKLVNRVSLEQSKVAAEKDKMIARLEGGIQFRNRCIIVLFSVLTVFMALLIAYLIFDIRNGDWGFIRYAQETLTSLIPGLFDFGTGVL